MATTLGGKAVGNIVKFAVNGTLRDFLIIQHGRPSSVYDTSFDGGTILLMKDIYESRQWNDADINDYANSAINNWLNNNFFALIDEKIRAEIKQVKIPYRPGSGTGTNINSGANGLAVKVWLLSGYEINWTTSTNQYFPADGSTLSYFAGTASVDEKRIANLNGIPNHWWLRSPATKNIIYTWYVHVDGRSLYNSGSVAFGIRPALVLPSSILVGDDGIITTNAPPTAPTSITVPGIISGGNPLQIAWDASTDPDGNLEGYQLERSDNGGTYTQIYIGNQQTFTDSVAFGINTVQYRVKAFDSAGLESEYTTSPVRTVTNNRPPDISGMDEDIGAFSDSAPSYNYTVTDEDGDTVTVVETLDGATIRTYTATLGQSETITFSNDDWIKILNGQHILKITATDTQNASAVRTVTFAKDVDTISFSLKTPFPADDMPTQAIVNIQGDFPAGSNLMVEICNNGNDTSPAWEDITSNALNQTKLFFANTSKTDANWGVSLRVKLERGTATQSGIIRSLGGVFK